MDKKIRHTNMFHIDMPKINEKVNEYVREFYTTPKSINTNASDTKYVEMLKSFFKEIIRKNVNILEVETLNKKEIPQNANKDGIGCLNDPLEIQEPLGEGYFGKVYKINSTTAAKIVPLNKHDDIKKYDIKNRILNEFEISRKAGELGVGPKVYDTYSCCSKNGECYYVLYMELLKGMTIWDWLKVPKIDVQKKKVKAMIAKKLDILHNNGIVHRDVHAGNIFVIGNHKKVTDVLIIDYGLAHNSSIKLKYEIDIENSNLNWIFNMNEVNYNSVYEYVILRMLNNKNIEIKE